MADNESGLDTALLGRLYRGSVVIDGFTPLPSGDWANLANSTISPDRRGRAAHFRKDSQQALVAAVRTRSKGRAERGWMK
jgi:hypothetical protein